MGSVLNVVKTTPDKTGKHVKIVLITKHCVETKTKMPQESRRWLSFVKRMEYAQHVVPTKRKNLPTYANHVLKKLHNQIED